MQTIEAYKTPDGLIFNDEDKAEAHENDLIGEEIDGLLRLVLGLEVNRRELINGFASAMRNKKQLKESISKLNFYLNFND